MRTINLTDDQANLLVCYILLTTQHRKEEQQAWAELAEEFPEKNVFKKNAEWYAELEPRLAEIKEIIDNSSRA